MQTGKRILLHDGRICFFQEYRGGRHFGESFTVSLNGTLEEIPITEYDCLLIRNEDVICPTCGGRHIMDGYLGNPDGTKSRFRENITDNQSYSPPYNIRKVRTHACRDCGYVMVFVKVNKEERD
jgi:RNA polymerase subunit RPABC4/transcription elongation factor Spt4